MWPRYARPTERAGAGDPLPRRVGGAGPVPGRWTSSAASTVSCSAGGNALQLLTDLIEYEQGRPAVVAARRVAAAAGVSDLGRRRPRGRVGSALAGDLPVARAARGSRGAPGPGPPGRAGARHRRDADPDAGHRRHPRDPARAARLRRRAADPGAPAGDRRSADAALRALLGAGHRPSRPRHPPPAGRRPPQPAAPAGGRRQGRADRPHPRPQPADRTPAGGRPDDRAGGGHEVPGGGGGRARGWL